MYPKKLIKNCAVFLIMISFLFFFQLAHAQQQYNIIHVVADGYSIMGEQDTIKDAKQKALKDAERIAIEQGTAVYIESYTKVKNFIAVDDEIKSIAAGYIINKKLVVDEFNREKLEYHIRIEADVKCGDLDKLITTKNYNKQIEKTNIKDLSLEFNVIGARIMTDGSAVDVLVKEGSSLRSYDSFQIQLKANNDCYIYVLLYDSEGKSSILFPNDKIKKNYLKSDIEYYLPQNDLFYQLDDNTGTETLYIVASLQPMDDIDWILEKMEKTGEDIKENNFKNTVGSRGIAGIVSKGNKNFKLSNGKIIQKVNNILEGKGTLYYSLSFNHEK